MKSMLTPSAATSRATTPNASAVIGLPSTTMVWVDGSRITGMLVAALDRHVEADAVNRVLDLVAQLGTAGRLGRARDQHAQRQPPADDDLFDVEQLDLVPRKHLEQRRSHAGLVDSGDGDQHRHLGRRAHPRLTPRRHQVRTFSSSSRVTSPSDGPWLRPMCASARIRSTMCG